MHQLGVVRSHRPANHGRERRLLAVATLLALSGGIVTLHHALTPPRRLQTVRAGSPLPALRGRQEDGTAWRTTGNASRTRPLALLYVSATCPHCHAELARWRQLLAARPGLARGLEVVVITPGSGRGPALPSVGRQVADPGALIAHTLGVNVVPLTLLIDVGGTIRSVSAGETDIQSIAQRLALASGVAHAP